MLLKYFEHVKKLQTDILYHEEGQNTVMIDFFLQWHKEDFKVDFIFFIEFLGPLRFLLFLQHEIIRYYVAAGKLISIFQYISRKHSTQFRKNCLPLKVTINI